MSYSDRERDLLDRERTSEMIITGNSIHLIPEAGFYGGSGVNFKKDKRNEQIEDHRRSMNLIQACLGQPQENILEPSGHWALQEATDYLSEATSEGIMLRLKASKLILSGEALTEVLTDREAIRAILKRVIESPETRKPLKNEAIVGLETKFSCPENVMPLIHSIVGRIEEEAEYWGTFFDQGELMDVLKGQPDYLQRLARMEDIGPVSLIGSANHHYRFAHASENPPTLLRNLSLTTAEIVAQKFDLRLMKDWEHRNVVRKRASQHEATNVECATICPCDGQINLLYETRNYMLGRDYHSGKSAPRLALDVPN